MRPRSLERYSAEVTPLPSMDRNIPRNTQRLSPGKMLFEELLIFHRRLVFQVSF